MGTEIKRDVSDDLYAFYDSSAKPGNLPLAVYSAPLPTSVVTFPTTTSMDSICHLNAAPV